MRAMKTMADQAIEGRRGAPDHGDLDYAALLPSLDWTGPFGAEYRPAGPTDDSLAWRTPDGTTIRVAEPAPATSAGGAMQLMVRPEAALLSPASAAPAGDGRNVLPGRIVEASYLGSHTEYVVEMGGSRVRIHSGDDLEHESDVIVSFAPTDAQLIPISRD